MRFPILFTRCDSPQHSLSDTGHGRPVVIEIQHEHREVEGPGGPESMTIHRRRDEVQRRDRGGIGGENKAAKAYRQGYLDASSLHIAHPLANGLSPRYPLSAIPPFLQDFAAEYPYITLASIGAVSTLTLLGSGYAATRLAKWCPLTSRLFGEVVEKRAAAGVAVGPVVWGKRMDDLERRMISQLQAANRERRSELDMFQRDVMNRLDTVASMGMTATASSTSEEYQSIDQRLNALADQIESASQDRRTGLEAFKTEVVRLLSAIEAQTSALEANNLEPLEIVADIRQMVSGVLHKVLSNYDFERKTSRKGDNGPIHTNTPKDVQVKAEEDEWALEPGRESFYEELRPGRHWDYAAMDAVAGQPAGIPAEQVAEQLEDAAAMMRERQCGSSRARDNTSHTASFGKTTTSFGAQREDAFPASVDASGMVGALDTVAQSFKDEATTRSTSRPESAPTSEPNNHDDQPTVANPDRIEIDDSGYWSFAIDMEPEQETKGAGWHSATLIYNNSDAIDRLGQNDILPSSTSLYEMHREVDLFFYPEFDIVRLDGQLWRCSRESTSVWSIQESIGEVTDPEWDGVGFEKD